MEINRLLTKASCQLDLSQFREEQVKHIGRQKIIPLTVDDSRITPLTFDDKRIIPLTFDDSHIIPLTFDDERIIPMTADDVLDRKRWIPLNDPWTVML